MHRRQFHALLAGIALAALTIMPQAAAQGWLEGPSTTTSHYVGTAILLQNGNVLIIGGRTPNTKGDSCELYDPQTNTIAPAPSMQTTRFWHSSIMLNNGKVLVLGGIDAEGKIRGECELYDPQTNTWSPTGRLITPRMRTTVTLLRDGRVLAVGGNINIQNSQSTPQCEIYNPETGTWSGAAALNQGRNCHAAVLLPSGKVLAVSGYGYTMTCELYNPDNNTWDRTGSLVSPFPTGEHALTLLRDGRVLLSGGWGGGLGMARRCELYDPATGQWSTTGSLNTPRCGHRIVLLPNGRVMAIGGHNSRTSSFETCFSINSCEIFDPQTGLWTPGPNIPLPITYFVGTMLPSGKIFISGGGFRLDKQSPQTYYKASFLLDPSTGTVTTAGAMPGGGFMPSATLLPGGRLMVAGGSIDCGALTSNQTLLYDPIGNAWTNGPAMAQKRSAHTASLLLKGEVLVAGGITNGQPVRSTELYNPAANIWGAGPGLLLPRALHTATALPGGAVMVAGGFSGGTLAAPSATTRTTEIYNPVDSRWIAGASMSAARYAHTATTLPNGKILVTGGVGLSPLSSCELYDPLCNVWGPAPAMTTARAFHTATLLTDGTVLVTGGESGGGKLGSAEIYDYRTDRWSSVGGLATGRSRHTATLLPNGDVVVAGGLGTGDRSVDNIEIFSLINRQWVTSTRLSVPRSSHAAALLPGGSVLLAGGVSADGGSGCFVPLQPDLYTPSLGYAEQDRPTITSISTNRFEIGGAGQGTITVRGTGFKDDNNRPTNEASSGDYNSSATNFPIVQIRRIGGDRYDNDFTGYLPFDAGNARWSSTETRVHLPFGAPGARIYPAGWYALTVMANGIPSLPVYFSITYTDVATLPGVAVKQVDRQCTRHSYDLSTACMIQNVELDSATSSNVALVFNGTIPSTTVRVTLALIDDSKPGHALLKINGQVLLDEYLSPTAITATERLAVTAGLDAVCDSIQLRNDGDDPLIVPSAHLLGNTGFTVSSAQFPIVVPPHGTAPIRVCFTPGDRKTVNDTLVIPDPCADLRIPVEGKIEVVTNGIADCDLLIRASKLFINRASVHADPPVVTAGGSLVTMRVEQLAPSETGLGQIRGWLHTLLGERVGEGDYVRASRQANEEVVIEKGVLMFDVSDWPQGAYIITLGVNEGVVGYPVNIVR